MTAHSHQSDNGGSILLSFNLKCISHWELMGIQLGQKPEVFFLLGSYCYWHSYNLGMLLLGFASSAAVGAFMLFAHVK